MTTLKSLDLKSTFFIALLVGLGLLLVKIISPFGNIIILSLIVTQLFYPIYKWVQSKTGISAIASLVSVLLATATIILPLSLISIAVISEVRNGLEDVSTFLSDSQRVKTTLIDSVNSINERLANFGINRKIELPENSDDLGERLNQIIQSVGNQIIPVPKDLLSLTASIASEFALTIFNLLFQIFIFILTLGYMFTLYEKLPSIVSRISPLDDELDRLLVNKFRDTTYAVVLGNFVVAIMQATAVMLFMLPLQLPSPALMWTLMVLLSLIPLGSGFVWFPVGIYLIVAGQPLAGLLLIIYSAIVINVVDTVLRPIVLRNRIKLHPLIILFSVLGGIGIFGALGILYGPLIAVFFTAMMEVYSQKYSEKKHEPVEDPAPDKEAQAKKK